MKKEKKPSKHHGRQSTDFEASIRRSTISAHGNLLNGGIAIAWAHRPPMLELNGRKLVRNIEHCMLATDKPKLQELENITL